jgi:hypothetical protein
MLDLLPVVAVMRRRRVAAPSQQPHCLSEDRTVSLK